MSKQNYIIDMNMPNFIVPDALRVKKPDPQKQEEYRRELNKWRSVKDNPEPKPEAPQGSEVTQAQVVHDLLNTGLHMAVKKGTPDVLRRLNTVYDTIADALNNKNGRLVLPEEDYKFLQSKFAKSDEWNPTPEVSKTVVAVQDLITNAAIEIVP